MDPKRPQPEAFPTPKDPEAQDLEAQDDFDPELEFDPDRAFAAFHSQEAEGSNVSDESTLPIPAPVEEVEERESLEDEQVFPTLPGASVSSVDDSGGELVSELPRVLIDPGDDRYETSQDPRIAPEQNFFKIGEVARIVGVKPYVLRYWEGEFNCIKPEKTSSRQRRYRRQDVALLLQIRRLRYDEQLTIARTRQLVQEALEQGAPVRATPVLATRRPIAPRPQTHTPYRVSTRPPEGAAWDRGHLLRRLQDMRTAVLDLIKAVED